MIAAVAAIVMMLDPASGCFGQVAGAGGKVAREWPPAGMPPPHAEPGGRKPGAMLVAPWYDLAVPASSLQKPAAGPALNLQPQQDSAEEIIVRGRRGAPAAGDAVAPEPMYEAAQSDSAQRLYAAGPVWYSPEQVRLMSDAKDALGLCGGLGGLLTCPNK